MIRLDRRGFVAAIATTALVRPALAQTRAAAVPRHGISMYGPLKYGPDFTHFAYADPAALPGGEARFAVVGTFDSLNPFILQGTPAAGVGSVFETLTVSSGDEPFSEYGLLARSIAVPDDRSFVRYVLDPEARWHDGQPVTPADVVWSLATLREKGTPLYRYYYQNVAKVEQTGDGEVTFTFSGGMNRELPLIVGQLPILPKHWFEGRAFEKPSLELPLGSGPYKVLSVDAGRSIVVERVADYWGLKRPVNRGRFNFGQMRYAYYRDSNVALEAFKAGRYDWRSENVSRLWATAYTGPAVERKLIVKEEFPVRNAGVMQGWVYNTRKEIFKDRRVRDALAYGFDFEWTNKTLFYGLYQRIDSYFWNTELASQGLPSPAELALLDPFKEKLPPEVFTEHYEPPKTDGSGDIRENLRRAFMILQGAGRVVKDGKLVEGQSGRAMRFEILLSSPDFERVTLPFANNLKRLGIEANVRTVDPAQYQNRIDAFDFDMTVGLWAQSLSPGNEQREYWGSSSADTQGSQNLAGIADPVVDALIQKIIGADSREALVTACHALDRVLLWGYYVIPQWRNDSSLVAFWDKFDRPKTLPLGGVDLTTWWIEPGKLARLREGQAKLRQP
jgi:microcin C transport system substrate-binding protein